MRPSVLPKVREQVVRYLRHDDSDMHEALMRTPNGYLDVLARYLPDAALYWVTAGMAALAVSAGSKLDAVDWADRPAHAGLIVFDEDIGSWAFTDGLEVPVAACAWAPEHNACRIWIMQSRMRVAEFLPGQAWWFTPENVPPLIPLHSVAVPVGEARPLDDVEPEYRTILGTLAAAWLLMEQPVLAERRTERPDRAARRADARAGRPTPEVTLIDLRREYLPQERDPNAEEPGRHYKHRFVVSGHWRNQAHGPEHSLRRRQWVPSYVKGPDGAPLLVTEKVNVWRR